MQGLLTASITIGGVVGSFIGPYIANIYGRRLALVLCGLITIVFGSILGSIDNYVGIVFIRSMLGIGVGFSCTVGPLYMAEISPVQLRGSLGVLFEIGITTGMLLAMLINYVCSNNLDGNINNTLSRWSYGLQFGLGALPGIILCLLPVYLQETNVHNDHIENKLVHNDDNSIVVDNNYNTVHNSNSNTSVDINNNNDNNIQHNYSSYDYTITDSNTNNKPIQITQIKIESIDALDSTNNTTDNTVYNNNTNNTQSPWYNLFFTRNGLYCVFLGLLLSAIDMLTGINAIFFYSPTIFVSAGLSNVLLYTFATVGVVNLVSCIPPYYCVDRYGRRVLFLISLCGMTISMLLLSLNYIIFPSNVLPSLSIVFVLLYLISWQFGTGSLFFLMAAELYSDDLREQALSLTNAISWSCNILVSFIFPVLNQAIGIGYTFLIQFSICVICLILTYFYLPETKTQSFASTQVIHG